MPKNPLEVGQIVINHNDTSAGVYLDTGTKIIDNNGAYTGSVTPTDLALTSADFFVGNASNVAVGVAMSGDATLANTGAVAIATGAITGKQINASAFVKFSGVGVDASGGAANATVTGVHTGDRLLFALDMTDATDITAKFATTANGTGTISQLNTNLSTKTILWLFLTVS